CARSIAAAAWGPLGVAARVAPGLFTAAVILARHECRRPATAGARRAVPRPPCTLRRRSRCGGPRVRVAGHESHAGIGAPDAERAGRRVQSLRDVLGGLPRPPVADARHPARTP